MKCYYDFHIHSCLSSCGDEDMTPNNIVNMSLIKGLDAIAVTDHNCAKNLPAILECARDKLVVLCGMEVESCEEVHMVCLFASYEACAKMEDEVMASLNYIRNDVEIFGEQTIMDKDDKQIASIDNLLATATSLSVYEIVEIAHKYGGVCIAAHIDKSSYSIISNLGFISDDLYIDAVEISKNGSFDELVLKWESLGSYKIVSSSDAHYICDISERVNYIEVDELCAQKIIDTLRKKTI